MISYTSEQIESLASTLREAPSTSLWGAHIMVRTDKAAEMYVALSDFAKLLTAARKIFSVKGRHNTQVAMCELGDLLGIETYRPGQNGKGVDATRTGTHG